jgi:hypothetical protein
MVPATPYRSTRSIHGRLELVACLDAVPMLDILRRLAIDWATPRRPSGGGFALRCWLDETPATGVVGVPIPAALAEFWRQARGARLFEDTTYGQWGLILFDPGEAAQNSEELQRIRSRDARRGDLIVGEFRGDSDLLLLRCDPDAPDFGSVMVALPIDQRVDWPTVAPDLTSFVQRFADSEGDKFWERASF